MIAGAATAGRVNHASPEWHWTNGTGEAHGNHRGRTVVYGLMKTVALLLASLALLAAACTTGGSSAAPSPTQPPITITTPDEAARLVLATDSRFRGIGPFDPSLIGQAAWYRATPTGDGFEVVVRIGWGDCPSGCIDEHTWTYQVTSDGTVGFVSEQGPAVPPDIIGGIGGDPGGGGNPGTSGNPGTGELGVSGRVTAGPTCPVMQNPPDPACADRPVVGAILIVTDDAGREVARGTSDTNGDFSIPLEPGHYVVTPQPVEGLMGTAQPVDFTIGEGGPAFTFEIAYDTGIR